MSDVYVARTTRRVFRISDLLSGKFNDPRTCSLRVTPKWLFRLNERTFVQPFAGFVFNLDGSILRNRVFILRFARSPRYVILTVFVRVKTKRTYPNPTIRLATRFIRFGGHQRRVTSNEVNTT